MPRTLILRTDHLGDAVLTTPLLRALAAAGHTVDFVLPDAFVPLFARAPFLDRCLGLDAIVDDWKKHWLCLARWIRTGHYDIVILPHAAPWQLPVASFLSGVPVRIAMWGGIWGRLTGHRCLRSRILTEPRPYADIMLDCARALGVPPQGLDSEIFPEAQPSTAPKDGTVRIGIHPGCAGNTCNYEPADYETLTRWFLEETEWNVVLTGSPAERALIRDWDPQLLSHPRLENRIGALTLDQLSALLQMLNLFISTGTGPLHMSAALRVPTLTPFCARPNLSHLVWGNRNGNSRFLETRPEQCREVPPGCHCRLGEKIPIRTLFEQGRAMLQ